MFRLAWLVRFFVGFFYIALHTTLAFVWASENGTSRTLEREMNNNISN